MEDHATDTPKIQFSWNIILAEKLINYPSDDIWDLRNLAFYRGIAEKHFSA